MARQASKGYQVRGNGIYGTLKVNGKSYVSPRYDLEWLKKEDDLKAELDIWRATLKRDLKKKGGIAAAPQHSLARDIRRYLATLPEGRPKNDLASWLGRWAETKLGGKPRSEITAEDVDRQLTTWSKGPEAYAGSSLNHLRQSLISLWCGLDCKRRERGKRCRDPKHLLCPAMQIAKFTEAKPRQGFFEVDQFVKVLEHLPSDLADFATFAFISGWRRGEISGLLWTDCDLAHKIIRLPGERTKSGKPRILPIGAKLQAVMDRRVALGRDIKFVFSYINAKKFKGQVLPIKDFRKRWARACRQAGVPGALVHDFRRTAARNGRRAGLSERETMERTGHSTRSTFERYNIVDERDMKERAERFEDSLKW